ncbi:MAG: TaqI-like C-terminal specificity domain-containing protein [Bacteroidales bacterium]|jgi:hypothetical protein
MLQQNIFGDKNFKQKLALFNLNEIENLEAKTNTITKYIKSLESGRIEKTKEKSIQADFLNNFFGDVLEYNYNEPKLWNLEKECKSFTDGTVPDGALGFFSMDDKNINYDVRVVIELKDALTDLDKPQNRLADKRTPVEQAFTYSSKAGGHCKWVIVSNFKEIRLYHVSDQSRYENFIVQELLNADNLHRFLFLLQKKHLISKESESFVDILYRERQEAEQIISKQFYNQYKNLRIELFEHLKQNNSDKDELFLLTKSQKLLDRFIFICFCEDTNLLPTHTLNKIKDILKNAFDFEPNKLWRQLKGLFCSIDIGNPPLDINKFNGGLFSKDDELDNLLIKDDIILKLIDLSEYDFDSDLNVNILGHIFEQSLSDIEELQAKIGNGNKLSEEEKTEVRKNGKRKKDGIFYTPEYITRYIVKEAIGGWLEEQKKELGFYNLPELNSEDFQSIKTEKKQNKTTKKYENVLTCNSNVETHLTFLEAYKNKLRNIKILDPACGSGAFLNQAFDYLFTEGQKVNDELSRLRLGQREVFELDRHILTNNIFGVDLNPESVEITKLSLWLKTANRGKELTALDENIKCGNSLIDDTNVAGEKAFNWFLNFPTVFPSYRKPVEQDKQNDFVEEPSYNYGNPNSKGFSKHGFDIIIGNPPYGTTFNKIEKDYLTKFDSLVPDFEIYIYFISRGMNLLKNKGVLSYIFPNTFLSILYGKSYRQHILDNFQILSITDLSNDQTFEDASVRTCIFSVKKETSVNYNLVLNAIQQKTKNIISFTQSTFEILSSNVDNWLKLFHYSKEKESILDKIKNHFLLEELCEVSQGLIPYDKYRGHDEYTIKNRIWHSDKQKDNSFKKELKGGDVSRYSISWNGNLWISYGDWLAAPREQKYFTLPRILIREIVNSYLFCSYVEEEYYNTPSIINVIQKNVDFSLKYLLAILNSKLIVWYHYHTSPKAKKGLFPKILINDVRNIPIPAATKKLQQPFIEKAETMLSKNKQLQEIRQAFIQLINSKWSNIKITGKLDEWYKLSFENFRKELEKQKIKLTLQEQAEWLKYFNEQKQNAEEIYNTITKTDKEIDNLVYKLYELTAEEIKIIES